VRRDVAALFRRLTHGVYVIGVAQGDRRNAFTAAWVTQVSFDPLLIALSINPANASHPLLAGSGAFTVNVLARGSVALARDFGLRSGRDVDKLTTVRWRAGGAGAPVLEDGVAYLDCRVVDRYPAGDHEIVVARVVSGSVTRPDVLPMLYSETGDLDGSEQLYPDRLG
jgi:flavin reductase (DIM6/NTAB) family NADH-FMN oxidoreductase RutF